MGLVSNLSIAKKAILTAMSAPAVVPLGRLRQESA